MHGPYGALLRDKREHGVVGRVHRLKLLHDDVALPVSVGQEQRLEVQLRRPRLGIHNSLKCHSFIVRYLIIIRLSP